MSQPKFRVYEIVRVGKNNPELAEIHGERGAILGMTDGMSGPIEYGVYIYRDEILWQVSEDDLEATGEHASRGDFYDDTVVRVNVDEKGRGRIAD